MAAKNEIMVADADLVAAKASEDPNTGGGLILVKNEAYQDAVRRGKAAGLVTPVECATTNSVKRAMHVFKSSNQNYQHKQKSLANCKTLTFSGGSITFKGDSVKRSARRGGSEPNKGNNNKLPNAKKQRKRRSTLAFKTSTFKVVKSASKTNVKNLS